MHKEAKFSGVQFPLQKHNQNQRKTLRCNLSSSPVRRSGCCLRTLGGSLNSHFPEKSHKLYPRGGEVQGSPDSGKYLRECTACQGGNESFNIFFLWLTFFQIPQTPAFMAGFERPKKNWLFALVTAKKNYTSLSCWWPTRGSTKKATRQIWTQPYPRGSTENP